MVILKPLKFMSNVKTVFLCNKYYRELNLSSKSGEVEIKLSICLPDGSKTDEWEFHLDTSTAIRFSKELRKHIQTAKEPF